jgi:hypothetical protein
MNINMRVSTGISRRPCITPIFLEETEAALDILGQLCRTCHERHTVVGRVDATWGGHHLHDGVLNYYFARSEVDLVLDAELPLARCTHEAANARARFKYKIKALKENGTQYEMEVATSREEYKYPHLVYTSQLKWRQNKRVTQGSFKKLGRKIRGHIKPISLDKSSLTRLEVPNQEVVWKEIQGKGPIEEHISQRNEEKFSHSGKTSFGYLELDEALGHTCDSPLAEYILEGKAEHPALSDEALHAFVKQLRRRPLVQKIVKPVITVDYFWSAVKCVLEKTSSSYPGRGIPHHKACIENVNDGLTEATFSVHAVMMPLPLAAGFCPERCKHVIYMMLEKTPSAVRTN